MSAPPKDDSKKGFDWEKGSVIQDKNYQPLGDVKTKGLPKISKAVAADPNLRKKERETYVANEQQKPYSKKTPTQEEFVIDESHSGLSDGVENSEAAKKLIDQVSKGSKHKGVDRFGKK